MRTKEALAEAESIPSNTLCRKYAKVQLADLGNMRSDSKIPVLGLRTVGPPYNPNSRIRVPSTRAASFGSARRPAQRLSIP